VAWSRKTVIVYVGLCGGDTDQVQSFARAHPPRRIEIAAPRRVAVGPRAGFILRRRGALYGKTPAEGEFERVTVRGLGRGEPCGSASGWCRLCLAVAAAGVRRWLASRGLYRLLRAAR